MCSTETMLKAGAAALCLAIGGTALANTIVVRASGPSAKSFPAGKPLAPGAKIVLARGDSLTVLDSKGTRTLSGPGTFGAEASAGATLNRGFTALVSTQNRRRARTGAVRGPTDGFPPSLWFANIETGGTLCLVNPGDFQFWRKNMEQDLAMTLKDDASGRSAPVAFPIGSNTAAWPAALPLQEGRGYTLSGSGQPVKLRFAMLAAPVAEPLQAYTAFSARGCDGQLKAMVTVMERAEAATPGD